MRQYDINGKVIPHYFGENYRGYDIVPSYRIICGKLIPCYFGRNPYDDENLCDENILKSPRGKIFKNRDEITNWIDKYTFLGQPGNEREVLCNSTWEYSRDEDGNWYLDV